MEVTVEVLFRQVYLLRCLYYDSLYQVGNRHIEASEDIEEEEITEHYKIISQDDTFIIYSVN